MMRNGQRTLLAASLLAVAVVACGPKGGAAGGQRGGGAPPLAVDVSQAKREDIATYVSLDGQVAPLQEATLSTPQSGNVVAVYVNEGQHVSAGQVLAKLDDRTLQAQLAQQQAQLAGYGAQLGSSTLQAPVTAAQASNTVATAQQQLLGARNGVATAQAAYQSAASTYKADQQLLAQGYVSQTQFEQARAQYVQAQQAFNNARDMQRQAEVALRYAQQQGTNAVPIQQQAIQQNRAQIAATQAQIRATQTAISQTTIRAPFAGVVTQRLLDPGAFAGPNQPVVKVSQIDTVYINVNVPDEDLSFIRSGTPVHFTSSSLGNRNFSGRVMDVNATPTSGTLSYRARIRVPNPGDTLRGGMLVSVNVRKEYHPNAVVVPRTAVFQTENGANVFTVVDLPAQAPGAGASAGTGGAAPAGGARHGKGGAGTAPQGPPVKLMQARLVPVKIGLQTDTEAEVRSVDVHPGTTIITTRPDALQDKSVVAIGGPAAGGPHGAQ